LYEVAPWPEVLSYKEVVFLWWDRCKTELKIDYLPARKRSGLTANSLFLIAPFAGKRCVGENQCEEHANTEGGKSSSLQVWTWDESERFVSGICALKKHFDNQQSYAANKITCYGCNHPNSCRVDDVEHSVDFKGLVRNPDCQYQDRTLFLPTCPGCRFGHRKQRLDKSHTYDEGCRWGTIHHPATRRTREHPEQVGGVPRRGKHPREPRQPAEYDPTAGEVGGDSLAKELEDEAITPMPDFDDTERIRKQQ
jgi:hypothetical protein